jgi:ketosteroid isomerase-like protein
MAIFWVRFKKDGRKVKVVNSTKKYFSVGKIDEAFAMVAENATWWTSDTYDKYTLGGTRSRAEYLEFAKGVFEVAPQGMRITPTAITAEGDRIAVVAESYAVVNGTVYSNLYHFLFKMQCTVSYKSSKRRC